MLGYELKTAVGTSVFIMAFTALTGAVSHMAIGGLPDLFALAVCAAATLLGAARVAALFANRADAKTLNRITGVVLTVLGGAMVLQIFLTMGVSPYRRLRLNLCTPLPRQRFGAEPRPERSKP
ncbi:MAG: sulfite exporter TauE/SafE family protein [Ruthenibacterium lactatiformans]